MVLLLLKYSLTLELLCLQIFFPQLDISDDGFLSLMNDDGDTKDDVKVPDGEVGEKINRLFKEEEKDTSECIPIIWGIPGVFLLTTLFRRCYSHFHG